ncbi:SDR family NAD(P)-dependent oxidoreductase [Lactobacillus sp.]|uniref:NmrA family NAD(P)-binding protein n=1 Tax=Lactobacillus sp. TaxID=1591 RepID=UPI0019C94323|nr:SDR family NAD(P)-dependent oxidoreductase [Lactobacillus sp.]MBD5429780.1 SDR family NAD(P)-dependent oxidoreductase [Lactobacillus sp.]
MKYLITSASSKLAQKVTHWLKTMTDEVNIRVGLDSLTEKNKYDDLEVEKVKVDYTNHHSIQDAFKEIDLVIYIPSIDLTLSNRILEFESILAGAEKANAKFIFASFFADQENNPFLMSPFYAYAERRLAGSGVPYSITKNTMYADPIVDYIPELIKRKNIIYPVGDQSLSFITLNDSAHAIACLAVQQTMRDKGQSYLLSMENNYNMIELAYIISHATETDIGYKPVSVEKFAKIYKNPVMASLYAAGGKGLLNRTSRDFHKLTGREPERMNHYLRNGYQIAKLLDY